MSITTTLFPPVNREAAGVAFLRTFWQVVKATGGLGAAGNLVFSATQLAHVNLTLLAYTLGAVLASGILSGVLAAGDILVHGLPDAYAAAATSSPPVADVTTVQPTAPAVASQPAAGVPPAVDPISAAPAAAPSFDDIVAPAPVTTVPAPTV